MARGSTGDDALSRHTDYGQLALEEGSLLPDPIEQFRIWLADADAEGIYEPNAMVLSTIGADQKPSSRTVLLRGISDHGFAFYTDYTSRKGQALAHHPNVSLVFPWYLMHRQVLVTGTVEKVSADDSDEYFASRPRGSQIGAWASDQSQPIASRTDLEAKVHDAEEKFKEVEAIPRPQKWGGFVVRPETIEFWAGRRSRLHDRIHFHKTAEGWETIRLQP
jgi:pyridoxamine 5'-phosphate oxidase